MAAILEQVRYWVAVLVVVSLPGALAYWFVVHPLAGFWRRFGARRSLAVVMALYGVSVVGLFLIRDRLLGPDLGPPHPLQVAVGALLLVGAALAQRQVSKQLDRSILVGVPELSSEDPGKLLITGPYAFTRNPRYLVILVAMVGYGLLLHYAGVWLMTLISFPGLYLITLLEEKELEERFGGEYIEYCRRVPRLLPRLR